MNEIVEIRNKIHDVRGARVMLDFDLAELYQVETKRLKEAVRRNWKRFEGDDFMFELTSDEYNSLIISLRTQNATSNERGGRRHMPFAFTEQGVAMLSSELEAIKAKLELLERNEEDNLEAINDLSEDMRKEIDTIYQAIAALSVKETSEQQPRRKIGFKTQNGDK